MNLLPTSSMHFLRKFYESPKLYFTFGTQSIAYSLVPAESNVQTEVLHYEPAYVSFKLIVTTADCIIYPMQSSGIAFKQRN